MSGKWPMLKAKKISSISILEAHTVTQHKPRRSPAHCRAPIGMPPPRGRRGANCAMTRRGGRGARWSGRGGDKGRARGGHAARVNKAYLFLRYCDSAWTPSKSTLPNRLRRPGRRAGVAVAVALQPKSPPGPRAVARTRARLRRLCLCPLRCGVGCCLLCFCLCMPPIYRANQPTRQGKRAAASAAARKKRRLASAVRTPPGQRYVRTPPALPRWPSVSVSSYVQFVQLSSIISLPYVFVLGFLPFARDETIRVHWRAAISSG